MKAKAGLVAVGFLIGMGAMAGSAPVVAEPIYKSAPVVGENQNVRNLFRLRCGSCHGPDGEGTDHDYPQLAPALKGNPFVQHSPPAALIQVIRKGRTGTQRLYHESYPNMPAFGAEAVPDVDALVRFLQSDLQR